ncbi:MAG TPA: L,D-transpeptidase [Acidimicrobiales bacterium]|nr:L,D-transpeptidase [Acidimicrobiales bacterium]
MGKRALGTLFVVLIVASAAWVRTRHDAAPVVVARAVAAEVPTTTAPPTTTPPPPPSSIARASRAVVPRAPLPPATPALTGPFWVAAATGNVINVHSAPDGPVVEQVKGVTEAATTTVLLVRDRVDDNWIEAYLPTRPNSHTGFINASEVSLSTVDTQIKVELGYHRLTAWAGDRLIAQEPVAIGTAASPTPTGIFYLAMLFRSPNPSGAYGPYVFGLSAHSNVYEKFGGGDGMVGVHGTNQPGLIGRSVSHGCIRMYNASITKLVGMLPIGTPIVITG